MISLFFVLKSSFIYLREKEQMNRERGKGSGRGQLIAEQGAQQEAGSQDPMIMT